MRRRTLLRVILGVALLALTPAVPRYASAADPVTSLQVPAWQWRELPGTGGLQVHSTRATTVTWAAGVVTVGGLLRLTMPGPGERHDMPGPGWGVAVRRTAR
jgi:hypothetical protein